MRIYKHISEFFPIHIREQMIYSSFVAVFVVNRLIFLVQSGVQYIGYFGRLFIEYSAS